MATETPVLSAEVIGATAGLVWKVLAEGGPMSLAKVVKAVAQPRDLVMQAVGWLAREDKLVFEGTARSRLLGLRAD